MTGIISYGTITIEADSSGYALGAFTDIDSIQTSTVRVYNSGTTEVFVGFGSSDGEEAFAVVPTGKESKNAFSIPPKDSVILYKGENNDQVAAITGGGKAFIRVTAIDQTSAGGGNLMSSLELVSVLKDAMSNQKLIDAASKKLSESKAISDTRRKEAADASKTIEAAKKASVDLQNAIKKHEDNISAHAEYVAKKESDFAEKQGDIDSQKQSLVDAYKEQADAIAALQQRAESRHVAADAREAAVAQKERATLDWEIKVKSDAGKNESDKQKNADDRAKLDADIAAHEAKAKKLAEAIG